MTLISVYDRLITAFVLLFINMTSKKFFILNNKQCTLKLFNMNAIFINTFTSILKLI